MAIIPYAGLAEPFSSLSHLLGAGLFLLLAPVLVWRGRGDAGRVVALTLFSVGAVALLSVSGVYHLLDQGGDARSLLRRIDHACIFVLIACTFTPVHWILFRGWGRWGMLALIWSIGIAGLIVKLWYFESLPKPVSLGLYLGMGWLGLGSGLALLRRYPFRVIEPVLFGGIAYSIGAVLEFLGWPTLAPGVIQAHEVFHVAVLIGLALHWAFIYSIADGALYPTARPPEPRPSWRRRRPAATKASASARR